MSTAAQSQADDLARTARHLRTRLRITWAILFGISLGIILVASYYLYGIPLLVLAVVAVIRRARWNAGHSAEMEAMEAEEADPERHGKLIAVVEELVARADLPMPRVYTSTSHTPNAFAIMTRDGPALCVMELTLEILTERELRAVVGHELSHLRNRDTALGLAFDAVRTTIIWVATALAALAVFFALLGAKNRRDERDAAALGSLLAGTGAVVSTFLYQAAGRTREYLADIDGARIGEDPVALASALRSMEEFTAKQSVRVSDVEAIIAPISIVSPFAPNGLVSRLFDSHPTTARRERRLLKHAGEAEIREFEQANARAKWLKTVDAERRRVSWLQDLRPTPCRSVTNLPFKPLSNERLWWVESADLVETRSRNNQLGLVTTQRGQVIVTNERVAFVGLKRTEWRFKNLSAREIDRDWRATTILMRVTNRQNVSGITVHGRSARELVDCLQLALADHEGQLEAFIQSQVRSLRELQAERPG